MTRKKLIPRFRGGGKPERYQLNSERIYTEPGSRKTFIQEQKNGWLIPENLTWRDAGDPTTNGPYGSGPLNQEVLRKQNFYDFVLDNPRAVGVVDRDSINVAREFEGKAGDHWRKYKAGSREEPYKEYYDGSSKIQWPTEKKSFFDRLSSLFK